VAVGSAAKAVAAVTVIRARDVPPADACVLVPGGTYRLGEPGEERDVAIAPVVIGRYAVTNAHVRAWVEATGRAVARDLAARLALEVFDDHPATGLTHAEAAAYCAWLGERARLPTSDEWEAAARGHDGRPWPWGDVFDPERCNADESGWGATVPVTAHPRGAAPTGAEQLAGNVWEWVDGDAGDGWVPVRGGCFLDTAWGVRASRVQPADPQRATATTGLRIAMDPQ
jgi:formylglycine-generating enzyme required for sulfatase activity